VRGRSSCRASIDHDPGGAPRALATGSEDPMGSVIKKRRKRMAKKKHRKLLRKTRHQRRNKK
jgi:hypothetical protein